jgi:hypothetical protein
MLRLTIVAAMVLAGGVAQACDGYGGGDEATRPAGVTATAVSATATPTRVVAQPSPVDDSGEVAAQTDRLLLALQSGDRDRIETLSAQAIPLPELERLATCVAPGTRLQITARNITATADGAEAVVGLTITPEGLAPYDATITVGFIRAGEEWLVSPLPDCPVRPA